MEKDTILRNVSNGDLSPEEGALFLHKLGFKIQNNDSSQNNRQYRVKELGIPVIQDSSVSVISKLIKKIEEIVGNLLSIDAQLIDKETNFITIGLDSVMIMELTELLSEKLEVDLYPTLLFEEQNIKELATYLVDNHKEPVYIFLGIDEEMISVEKNQTFTQEIKPESITKVGQETPKVSIENIKQRAVITDTDDIAIIGMGAKLPGANSIDEFWENLITEKSSISSPPLDRKEGITYGWDNTKELPKGGFIDDIYDFDPAFFNISPREVEYMDPQQRLLLKVVWNGFEDAGYDISKMNTREVGLFVGASTNDFFDLMISKNTPIHAHSSTGSVHSILANRISYLFNFGGPSEVVDTACSSSLVALNRAVLSLKSGECKIAVVAGVNALLTGRLFNSFQKGGMLSEDWECKTFDEHANGYVRGEGAGCIILKKREDAERSNDGIYAYVKNVAVNHGGRSNSLTAPNVKSQIELYKKAYEDKGINPLNIGYIEAQGTGTKLGDSIEVSAITKAIKEMRGNISSDSLIFIGSAKTNIGHLEAASGIVSIIKSVLILKNRKMPKTLNIKEKSSYLNMEGSPIRIAEKLHDWEIEFKGIAHKNLVGVSAFGFGGTNAHAVLKAVESIPENRTISQNDEVIVLSAKDEKCLKRNAEKLKLDIEKNKENIVLSDLAYTLQIGRKSMETRVAFVANSLEMVLEKLEKLIDGKDSETTINTIQEYPGELLFDNSQSCIDFCKALIHSGKIGGLLQKWKEGEDIPFSDLQPNVIKKRIHLSGYQFHNKPYYLPESNMVESNKKDNRKGEKNINTETEKIDRQREVLPLETTKNHIENNVTIIKKILAETLKVPSEEIGIQVPFIDLGLDSVLGMEFIEKINDVYDISLEPIVLYDYIDIKKLSTYLLDDELIEEKTLNTDVEEPVDNTIVNRSEEKHSDLSEINEGIAIVGMSGKFPGADNLDEFWDNLTNARCSVKEVPLSRWDADKLYDKSLAKSDSTNCKWGGFIDNIDEFDPSFFKISPREAIAMDPQQRLFLMEAWKALDDAGYSNEYLNGKHAGVFVGVSETVSGYKKLLKDHGIKTSASTFIGNTSSILSARIAYHLNLKGPALSIDTACSSSLVALHLAMESIENGTSDIALTGGVCALPTEEFHIDSGQARMLSPKGLCKAFDTNADGFVPAEGVGVLVLKKLKNALADGDRVHAVLMASDINQDGAGNGITAPNSLSQQELIEKVMRKAKVTGADIGYVEAHGSGTPLGDPIEVKALTNAYQKDTQTKNYCHIGSVKSNIGHALTAAGSAGILKMIYSLKHKRIPPTLHISEKNNHIEWAKTPFIVNSQSVDWKTDSERIGAVSSFGFSGTNAHILIKEFTGTTIKTSNNTAPQQHLVCFSSKSEKGIISYLEKMISFLENTTHSIRDIAYMLSTRKSHFGYRLSFEVSSVAELQYQIKTFLENSSVDRTISFTVLSEVLFTESQKNNHTTAIANLDNDRRNSLKTIQQLYHQGYKVDWKQIYNSKDHNFIELPKNQMNLQSYWPSTIKKEQQKEIETFVITKMQKEEVLDTFFSIDPVATSETEYLINLYYQNDVIKDHKVKGESVLPGVSYIEILLKVLDFTEFDRNSILVENIHWLKPLVFYNNDQQLCLKIENDTFSFYRERENKKSVYVSGSIRKTDVSTSMRTKKYSLEKIKEKSKKIAYKDIYAELKKAGLQYGKAFSGVEKIWQNGQWALSKIEKKIENSTINNYAINPAILDAALHGVFKLLNMTIYESNETPIPVKIHKIQLFDTIDSPIYSYIKEVKSKTGKNVVFNLILLKNSGQVLAIIEGLELQVSELVNFYN